ncbi:MULTISPECIES: hypothetical protein [unclassified Streptomyces]|uniref:hypothetical protein n=1 Tax=unclassified Streptomyces TaxID=2593676 RepID=UPI00343CEAED
MPSRTAEELLAGVHGPTPERAQRIGDRIDSCRQLREIVELHPARTTTTQNTGSAVP